MRIEGTGRWRCTGPRALSRASRCAAAVLAFGATPAGAAVYGSDLTPAVGNAGGCSADTPAGPTTCTLALVGVAADGAATGGGVIGQDGTVREWRLRYVNRGGPRQARLVLVRGQELAGQGQFETLPAAAAPGTVAEFSASVPVRRGDLIGLEVAGGSGFLNIGAAGGQTDVHRFWSPALAAGAPRAPNFADVAGFRLLIQAEVAATKPQTKITKATLRGDSATFRFSSTADEARFQCRIDRGAFRSCRSPKKYTRLEPGRHTFSVRAIVDGTVDATPAKRRFTIDAN